MAQGDKAKSTGRKVARADVKTTNTNKSKKSETKSDAPRSAKRGKTVGTRATKTLSDGKTQLRLKLKEQKQNFIQSQILEVSAELIAARGFRAVTIDDISATLGYTKSVIYYYLESKNDILWRIFRRITESYFDSLSDIADSSAPPEVRLKDIVKLHATNVMTYRAWTAIYQRDGVELNEDQQKQVAREKREYDATVERVYAEGVKAGVLKDVPVHIAVAGLLGACNSIQTWYNPEGPLSVAEIAQYYADLLADGFLLHPPKT
jgi:AcrR family transcriptional regulator